MSNTKDLVNFLVSEFVIQTEEAMKKSKPKHNYGHIKLYSLLVDEKKDVYQRLTWDNFKGTTKLNEEEKANIEKTFMLDIDAQFRGENQQKKPCKSISCIIDVKKNEIRVSFEFIDGTNFKFNI